MIIGLEEKIALLRKSIATLLDFRIDGRGFEPRGRDFPYPSGSAPRPTQPPVQRGYRIPLPPFYAYLLCYGVTFTFILQECREKHLGVRHEVIGS
jgi:hypothetical protein